MIVLLRLPDISFSQGSYEIKCVKMLGKESVRGESPHRQTGTLLEAELLAHRSILFDETVKIYFVFTKPEKKILV
jgi:hypothetical protein